MQFPSMTSLLAGATSLLLPAMVAMAADDAHAAAGGHEEVGAIPTTAQGVVTGATALVVFGLVFAVLAVKVWPVIGRALDERANKIKSEIESAEQARRQAKEALEQYQQSLSQARAEAQKMLETAKAQQVAVAATERAKMEAELSDLKARAARDIETAKRTALNEIYSEASSLATAVASKILRREIRPDDQRALVEESLGHLKTVRN